MTPFLRFARLVAGLVLFGLLAVWFASVPSPKAHAGQKDPRTKWAYDDEDRYVKFLGKGKWARYSFGKLDLEYTETERTDAYIEIFTPKPQPTYARLYKRKTVWRPENSGTWQGGKPGGWVDTDK